LRWEFCAEDGEIPRGDFREFQLRFLDHYWRGLDAGTWAHWLVEDDGTVLSRMAVHVNEGVPRPGSGSGSARSRPGLQRNEARGCLIA